MYRFIAVLPLLLALLISSTLTSSSAASATSSPAFTVSRVFRDDFLSNGLNSAFWLSYANGGVITVNNGLLTLAKTGAAQGFPYIGLQSVRMPGGDYAVIVRMRYTSVGQGNGFA